MFPLWIKHAGLQIAGRFRSGANAQADASYGVVAIEDATRELMALAQLRLNDGTTDRDARCDSAGRLEAKLYGSLGAAILQDANGALVLSRPGAIGPGSTVAQVHLSTAANTLIFSAPGTQVWLAEQIVMANNNALADDVTLSLSTAANASRIFRGTITGGATTVIDGPIYIRPGKPLMGSGTVAGLSVHVPAFRVR